MAGLAPFSGLESQLLALLAGLLLQDGDELGTAAIEHLQRGEIQRQYREIEQTEQFILQIPQRDDAELAAQGSGHRRLPGSWLHHLADIVQQLERFERLGEPDPGAGFESFPLDLLGVFGGQHDEGEVAGRLLGLDPS